jgi:shikimate kinase
MRIFLIGFMGSGKSSLGKELAHKLGLTFFDIDQMIEEDERRKINVIFENDGEEKFREIEHECLKKSLQINNVVISTGGGTPCFFNNMEVINENGISVYIKLNAGILASRLSVDKEKRPLIKHCKDKTEIESFIKDLLEKREKYYLQSKFIIEGKNINAKKIIEALSGAAI